MARTYEDSRQIDTRGGASFDMLDLVRLVDTTMARMLGERARSRSFRVIVSGGVLSGQSLEQIEEELLADPSPIEGFSVAHRGQDISVSVSTGMLNPHNLLLNTSSPVLGEPRGWGATLEERIRQFLGDPKSQAAARGPQRVTVGLPTVATAERASVQPVASQAPEEAGWLKRTWRDHAALFVVTVLATVAAAIIVAKFGIH